MPTPRVAASSKLKWLGILNWRLPLAMMCSANAPVSWFTTLARSHEKISTWFLKGDCRRLTTMRKTCNTVTWLQAIGDSGTDLLYRTSIIAATDWAFLLNWMDWHPICWVQRDGGNFDNDKIILKLRNRKIRDHFRAASALNLNTSLSSHCKVKNDLSYQNKIKLMLEIEGRPSYIRTGRRDLPIVRSGRFEIKLGTSTACEGKIGNQNFITKLDDI